MNVEKFFECSSCGYFHKALPAQPSLAAALYASDCRNDANRFTFDDVALQRAEQEGRIEYLPE